MSIREIILDKLSGRSFFELLVSNPNELFLLLESLEEKQFRIAEIDIDHRSILHWEKEGIIEKIKTTKEGWRKYSFYDYVWLRVLAELRGFGIPIPVITRIKNELFHPAYDQIAGLFNELTSENISSLLGDQTAESIRSLLDPRENFNDSLSTKLNALTRFYFIVLHTIISRTPAFLLVNRAGDPGVLLLGEPNLDAKIKDLLNQLQKESTLLINISGIIDEFFTSDCFSGTTYYKLTTLSNDEKKIIELINAGKANKITIRLADETELNIPVARKKPARDIVEQIQGIVAKKNFRSIILDTTEGKISFIHKINP